MAGRPLCQCLDLIFGTSTGSIIASLRGLTQWAVAQLFDVMPDLTESERRKLASTSPHAFRHTVGTQMLSAGVALEVVQRRLGTTSIYVSPEEARMRREAPSTTHGSLAGPERRYQSRCRQIGRFFELFFRLLLMNGSAKWRGRSDNPLVCGHRHFIRPIAPGEQSAWPG